MDEFYNREWDDYMTSAEAFTTGFAIVRRHLWLPLLPLLWEVLLLGETWPWRWRPNPGRHPINQS